MLFVDITQDLLTRITEKQFQLVCYKNILNSD